MGALHQALGRPAFLAGGWRNVTLFARWLVPPIGFGEEYFPFVPVLITLALALGYDQDHRGRDHHASGYGVGYGAALINPFTVLISPRT